MRYPPLFCLDEKRDDGHVQGTKKDGIAAALCNEFAPGRVLSFDKTHPIFAALVHCPVLRAVRNSTLHIFRLLPLS